MNADRCLKMLREIKDVAFATVDENGKPQVRIIDVMSAEDEKLYFCTARGKDFYRQLIGSGDVAITGMNREYQMVRLSGRAKKLDDNKKWIDRIFEENPSMNDVYPDDSRYVLEPFCIDNGEVEFFDLGKSPIVRNSFILGTGEKENCIKGFTITEKCIRCGKCANICPQQCITGGTSYQIKDENCLHCGLCFENCPAEAIERRGEGK